MAIKATGAGSVLVGANWAGGVVPAATEDADLDGFAMTLTNGTFPPLGGSLNSIIDTAVGGGGTIAVDMTGGDVAILALTQSSGTAGIDYAYFILVTGAAPGNTLTYTGDLVCGTRTGRAGMYHNSSANLTLVGSSTGGAVTNGWGLRTSTAGVTTISGGVYTGGNGTGASALATAGTGALTVTGNCIGGPAAASARGLARSNTGTTTITGDAIGGGALACEGIYDAAAAGTVTLVGNIIDNVSCGVGGFSMTWVPSPGNYHELVSGTRLRNPRRTIHV